MSNRSIFTPPANRRDPVPRLLSGAALLIRSFEALSRVSPGFNAEHVLTMQISSSWGVAGARLVVTAWSGAGRARRSTLPLAFSGMASSTVMVGLEKRVY